MDKLHYYLGTGLKCHVMGECTEESEYTDNPIPKEFVIVGMNDNYIEYYEQGRTVTEETTRDEIFPLMRPLTSLTKPITVEGYNGGEPFVPLVHLRELSTHSMLWCNTFQLEQNILDLPFWIIEKLISWHFWPFDQTLFGKSLIEIKE